MKQYEYKYIRKPLVQSSRRSERQITKESLQEVLNELGKAGWKLTDTVSYQGSTDGFIFIREKK